MMLFLLPIWSKGNPMASQVNTPGAPTAST
jgi:hypothetical protein